MPFIIWGSKGVTNTTGGGQFQCPTCGPTHYTQKKVHRTADPGVNPRVAGVLLHGARLARP